MKKSFALLLIMLLVVSGAGLVAAQDADRCSEEAVARSFAIAVQAGTLETWVQRMGDSNCPAEVVSAAERLARAYTAAAEVEHGVTRPDCISHFGLLCDIFVLSDGKETAYEEQLSTSLYTEDCARSGLVGLHLQWFKTENGAWGMRWDESEQGYVDVSAYTHLSFWVRGTESGATFRVEMKDQSASASKPGITVESRDWGEVRAMGWREFTVPFSQFDGLDPAHLVSFGLDFNKNQHKSLEICVDDVTFLNLADEIPVSELAPATDAEAVPAAEEATATPVVEPTAEPAVEPAATAASDEG